MEKAPDMMKAIGGTAGLVMKTFLAADENNLGGFYLFASADQEHFQVEDEPSKALGTPTSPLAG
jgi:hypothetical protein